MLPRFLRFRVFFFALGLGIVFVSSSPMAALAATGTGASNVRVCAQPAVPTQARCGAIRRTDITTIPARPGTAKAPVASPNTLGNGGAYDPPYLQSAYNLATAASTQGAGRTVALVDAYDDPSAESDLAYYRNFFGLSPCTSSSGCFKKVNQNGVQGSYPAANSGWAQETSLDLDMVSAICPKCSILLVEANSATFGDLGTAENTAAAMGAVSISNSYGASEFSSETAYDSYYNHPGIAVTVSSGDNGYGVEYPAASQYVTAVGGTSLYQSTNTGTRNATESAWSGAGSGCSAYESKPSWQRDAGCAKRTVADVSAVADPNTGVWVYDQGWYVFGGTSVASPIISAVYGLTGTSTTYGSAPYKNTSSVFDITSGSNGNCGGSYLCTAAAGYDGPTGLGTPNGTTAFGGSPATSLSISFNTAPQTVTAGAASAAMTVQLLNNGVATAPSSPVSVTLSSSSSTGTFAASSSGPWASTLGITVPTTGSLSGGFYYQDTKAGSPVATAAATGYTSGTQTETVTAAALATISVTPSSATVSEGASQVFSASGTDTYGNAVSVSSAAWTVSAPGTLNPATGASTTFTASGTTTASGTVVATIGTVSNSATITVTAGATVPGAPTALTANPDARRGIDLSWVAPTNNGGSAVTSYIVYRGSSSGTETSLVSVSCSASTCSYRDTSAKKGQTFWYTVAAVNSVGPGPMSNETSATAR